MSLSKSIDLLAASMDARARAQEIFANNLANVATDGFLRERVSFAGELDAAAARIEARSMVDRAPGPVSPTGRPSDVAMNDEGFLVVETADGERYRRGGSLVLDAEGVVADRQGNPVLGQGGPIMPGTAAFQISRHGEVLVDGKVVGTLRVVEFPQAARLEALGSGLYMSDLPPTEVMQPTLAPGHLQSSNVDVISEMVTMVESARLYETTARALRTYDEMIGRLVQSTQQSLR